MVAGDKHRISALVLYQLYVADRRDMQRPRRFGSLCGGPSLRLDRYLL